MLSIRVISIFALLIVLPTGLLSHPFIRLSDLEKMSCRPCGEDCDGCEYGVVFSPLCRALECRKGPDEHCSTENSCAEGLSCICEKCIGCSIEKLKCSDSILTCLPRQGRYKHLERSRQFSMV
ncbi:uncharacterized protein [Fopius arisanus]|uniref:Uncharacterized protein n=2 Tax=Fopius arisanus TaxID=64838 RepID=A0A9R1U324_9HYME|nr:PREDICTED: uncharacterized protein LOC105268569 [Fopius arisanus]